MTDYTPRNDMERVFGRPVARPSREPQGVLWACVDCTMIHANGEIGDDSTPDREPWGLWTDGEEITMGMLREEHAEDCDPDEECDCETDQFSWRMCEGCGSPLGGERHAFTYWA